MFGLFCVVLKEGPDPFRLVLLFSQLSVISSANGVEIGLFFTLGQPLEVYILKFPGSQLGR